MGWGGGGGKRYYMGKIFVLKMFSQRRNLVTIPRLFFQINILIKITRLQLSNPFHFRSAAVHLVHVDKALPFNVFTINSTSLS